MCFDKKTLLAYVFGFFASIIFSPLSAQTVYKWTDEQGRVRFSDRPPSAQKDAAGAVEHFRSAGAEKTPESTLQELIKNAPVVLYSKNSTVACKRCDQARAFLQERGVPFEEKYIVTEDDLIAYRMLFDSQNAALPGISIGATAHHGFSDTQWNASLDQAGYPRKKS